MRKNKGLGKESILKPEDCGKVILALCSGLMGAINGQIINADLGLPFRDNSMMEYMDSRLKT